MFGDRMVSVALAFAVLEVDSSPTAVGLVLAARTLPLVGTLLFGGVVADRVSRRAIMVVSDLVRLVTQGLLAALVIAGSAELWSLALLSGLGGMATGFFSPASTGLLPMIVSPERLQPANGIRATLFSAGEIAGPVAAGVLVAVVGAGWALAVDAATFGVSALFLARLRMPAQAEREPSRFLADLRDGWDVFRSMTWVWAFVLWASIANLTWGSWVVLGPVIADRDLGGAAAWGTILAMLGVGALLGGMAAIGRAPRRPIYAAGMTGFTMVPALALLAVGAPAAAVAAGALVFGFGMMYGNTVWESALQRHVPAASLSRVSAYDWFGSFALSPVGMAMWGPIAAASSIGAALWISVAITVLSTVLLLAVRDVRRLRSD